MKKRPGIAHFEKVVLVMLTIKILAEQNIAKIQGIKPKDGPNISY